MVTAADGIAFSDEVQMPAAELFEDGALKASSLKFSVFKADVNTGKHMSYTAEEASAEVDYTSYGLRIEIDYPKLSYSRNYSAYIVIYAPNDYIDVFDKERIRLDSRNSPNVKRLMIAFDSYLIGLKNTVDNIPAGTYTVELYLDGMHVATDTFNIR